MKTEHVIVYDNATDLNYTIELFDSNNVWFSLSWKVEYDNFNKHIYMITKIHMNWIVTKKAHTTIYQEGISKSSFAGGAPDEIFVRVIFDIFHVLNQTNAKS